MDLQDVFHVYWLTGNKLPYYERVSVTEMGVTMGLLRLCFYAMYPLGISE